jgi:hypothetical protein
VTVRNLGERLEISWGELHPLEMVRDGTHPTLQQHHSTANVVLREEGREDDCIYDNGL